VIQIWLGTATRRFTTVRLSSRSVDNRQEVHQSFPLKSIGSLCPFLLLSMGDSRSARLSFHFLKGKER